MTSNLFEIAKFTLFENVVIKQGFYKGVKGVLIDIKISKDEYVIYTFKPTQLNNITKIKLLEVNESQIRKVNKVFGFEF